LGKLLQVYVWPTVYIPEYTAPLSLVNLSQCLSRFAGLWAKFK